MKRRGFIKKSGIGAGGLFVGSSLFSFLASCTKMGMMNGGDMNMMGQSQPVTEGDFDKLLPIPGTVTVNTTLNAHPMHLHGVHFQVLERRGGRGQLIASEGGYKDTVLLLPGEIVKIHVPFAELKGVFVFHCHNLEHEDGGMMLQYQLT